MEDLTPNQRLDFVLSYLKQNPTTVLFDSLLDKIKKAGLEIKQGNLKSILSQLEGDGHVLKEGDELRTGFSYTITEKGKDFEGYVNKKAKEVSESIRLEKLESDQMANQKNMEILTFWIAFGTVAAAVIGLLLLGWQVYSYFHPLPTVCDVLKK